MLSCWRHRPKIAAAMRCIFSEESGHVQIDCPLGQKLKHTSIYHIANQLLSVEPTLTLKVRLRVLDVQRNACKLFEASWTNDTFLTNVLFWPRPVREAAISTGGIKGTSLHDEILKGFQFVFGKKDASGKLDPHANISDTDDDRGSSADDDEFGKHKAKAGKAKATDFCFFCTYTRIQGCRAGWGIGVVTVNGAALRAVVQRRCFARCGQRRCFARCGV